jgi:TolA-binding protein
LFAQASADQAADKLLADAQQAYREKNYPVAAGRFRDFINRYGGHKNLSSARYGLALSLVDALDYNAALEQLQPLAASKEQPERPYVLYYLGLAHRGLGIGELARAAGQPQAVAQQHAAAKRFEEAGRRFQEAAQAFAAAAKPPPPDAKELPQGLEWAARARCDEAEMQLRTAKARDARATVAPFLKDQVLARSRYRDLALYYDGVASFLQQDYLSAGRSLNLLAPFRDPVFGAHARFLLARVYHATDERAEATLHYAGVLADHEQDRKKAAEALQHPERWKNDPAERARLEGLTREPPPEYVGQAALYLGVILSEDGRFADARPHLEGFAKKFPKSPLAGEALLRLGLCQVQLQQFPDALRTLQPLADREPALADQAHFWIGKAQAGAAPPNNAQAYQQALETAVASFRRSADRANQRADVDPGVTLRRGKALLELADALQLAKKNRDAAAVYRQLLDEKMLPGREDEILHRLAVTLQLAGDFDRSDEVCGRFLQTHGRSPLVAGVHFCRAENAYFKAQAAPKGAPEAAAANEEAARRYRLVVEKFPDFPHANLARYSLALICYQQGDLEKAREVLESIPPSDRGAELAPVAYLLADCLLRLAPAQADDALAAGRLQEDLQNVVQLLDAFIAGQPKGPHTPEALLKLGLAQQRLAALFAQPQERSKALSSARHTFDKLLQQFPKHELRPQAVLERARCLELAGDLNGAANQLREFTRDPLKNAALAPLARLQLATYLRAQKKAAEAVAILAESRQLYEPALLKEPERAGWAALLAYHQGMALKEAGKLTEARTLLAEVGKRFPERPEAVLADLRWAQCLREQGWQQITKARDLPANAAAALAEGAKSVRDAAEHLEKQAERLREKQTAAELRARLLYEAAWAYRLLADAERQGHGQPSRGRPMDSARPGKPDAPPSAQKARKAYLEVMTAVPDLPLANEARFELGEFLAEQGDYWDAITVLGEALDKEPPAELADRIRLRLGACQAAGGDVKAALAQFEAVARNRKGPLAGLAHCCAGECLAQTGDWAGAVKHLARFRDQQPFRNLPGVSDRALLQLGQALGRQKQWDLCRQAHEQVLARFGNGPWAAEARYGTGWAWHQQKQYDSAVRAYAQVTAMARSGSGRKREWQVAAARAQIQIGLCRLDQKRSGEAVAALLTVPFGYHQPDLGAAAVVELVRIGRSWWAGSGPEARSRPAPLTEALVLAPALNQALPLPAAVQPRPERPTLEDPAGALSRPLVRAAAPLARTAPAPGLRLTISDPFEFHLSIRRPEQPAEGPLPLTLAVRLPR